MRILLSLFVAISLVGCGGSNLEIKGKAAESIDIIDLEPVENMPISEIIDMDPNIPPNTTTPIPPSEEEKLREEADEFYAKCTEFLTPDIDLPEIPEDELMTIGLEPIEEPEAEKQPEQEVITEIPESIIATAEVEEEEEETTLLPVVEDENAKLAAELIDIDLGNFHGDYEIVVPVGHVNLGNTRGNFTIHSAQSLKSGNYKGNLIVKSLVDLISLGNTDSSGNTFVKTQFAERVGNFSGKFCLGAAESVNRMGNYSGVLMVKGTGGERIKLEKIGNFKGALIFENVTVESLGNVRGLILLKNAIIKRIGNNKANIINL